jgi:hypothetical protein
MRLRCPLPATSGGGWPRCRPATPTTSPCGWSPARPVRRCDAAGAFAGWYVNLQESLRRTGSGFDTVDLVLDLVVAPRVTTPVTTICWRVRVRAWALWTDG